MLHYDNYEKLEDILREHLFSLSVIVVGSVSAPVVRVAHFGSVLCYVFVFCLSSYCVLCTGVRCVRKKKNKKKLYNTTRGRTHLLPFF